MVIGGELVLESALGVGVVLDTAHFSAVALQHASEHSLAEFLVDPGVDNESTPEAINDGRRQQLCERHDHRVAGAVFHGLAGRVLGLAELLHHVEVALELEQQTSHLNGQQKAPVRVGVDVLHFLHEVEGRWLVEVVVLHLAPRALVHVVPDAQRARALRVELV